MVLSEEDVAALLADLERVRRETEAMQADLKRMQWEKELKNGNMRRSWSDFSRKM